jgi:hypothetical protein
MVQRTVTLEASRPRSTNGIWLSLHLFGGIGDYASIWGQEDRCDVWLEFITNTTCFRNKCFQNAAATSAESFCPYASSYDYALNVNVQVTWTDKKRHRLASRRNPSEYSLKSLRPSVCRLVRMKQLEDRNIDISILIKCYTAEYYKQFKFPFRLDYSNMSQDSHIHTYLSQNVRPASKSHLYLISLHYFHFSKRLKMVLQEFQSHTSLYMLHSYRKVKYVPQYSYPVHTSIHVSHKFNTVTILQTSWSELKPYKSTKVQKSIFGVRF